MTATSRFTTPGSCRSPRTTAINPGHAVPIGQTLALEGVYSFFLESTFLGLLVFGEKLLGRIGHYFAAFFVFLGSWLSGFFIIATDAWMQHPVGYRTRPDGQIDLASFQALIFNPWTLWQYLHNMIGSVVTASFVMSSIGAFYLLSQRHEAFGRTFVRLRPDIIVRSVRAWLRCCPGGRL